MYKLVVLPLFFAAVSAGYIGGGHSDEDAAPALSLAHAAPAISLAHAAPASSHGGHHAISYQNSNNYVHGSVPVYVHHAAHHAPAIPIVHAAPAVVHAAPAISFGHAGYGHGHHY